MGRVLFHLLIVATLLGCHSRPARIAPPDWEPKILAARIMSELDANQDGALDDSELEKAPGLKAGKEPLDTNQDSRVDEVELTARFELYQGQRTGLQSKSLEFVYRGRPLAGATVRLVPEPFLEGVIEPAEGQTNLSGVATPRTAVEDIPAVRVGYYRVQVTSDRVRIPEKYNQSTVLGVEVSPVSDGRDHNVRFELKE